MNLTDNKVHHHTPCASAVLSFFGVKGVTWNDRTKKNVWDNTLRRNGFAVRSRFSKLSANEKTVGSARSKIAKIAAEEPNIIAFIVRVKGHVFIINREGKTVVDTSSRKRDKRELRGLWAIMEK